MLDIQQDGDVTTVRMDHGPVNALDLEIVEAIIRTIAELDADPEVGAVVLTGNARAFCAGVDLRRIVEGGATYTEHFLAALSAAFMAPLRSATPVVAAVNGHAIAGGAILAAACDVAIGADDGRMRVGLAELAVGVPFPTAAIEIMRRRLGPALQRAVMSATTVSAQEALDMGFLDQLVPASQLTDVAREVAVTLAAVPRQTMTLAKKQLWRPVEVVVATEGENSEVDVHEAWTTDAVRSAIGAFMQRTLGTH